MSADSNDTSKQVSLSIGAYPEEIECWRKAADDVDRSLSWWVRKHLNAVVEKLKNHPNGSGE